MEKQQKKLVKLNIKAQECLSREKALKILKKENKVRKKMTKISEGESRFPRPQDFPQGVS